MTFRTRHGAPMFCLSRRDIATLKKPGLPVLDYVQRALEGDPYLPPLPP